MNKKVGIITLYYNTRNFGGALQAFALCKALSGFGYQAEQITYDIHDINSIEDRKLLRVKKVLKPKKLLSFIKKKIYSKVYGILYRTRNIKLQIFLDNIPHSTMYTKDTIVNSNDVYDIFIAGSDQVWNFDWYNPNMFLEFVRPDKTKISYAASLGRNHLSIDEKSKLKYHLKGFSAVSVREPETTELINSICGIKAECVLDPTLIVDRKVWDEVASESDLCEDNYIFCYFLSENVIQKNIIRKFAQRKRLRVLYIPNVEYFSLIGLYNYGTPVRDATISDFVWLVKHADYIFTDSFHCSVFSCLYKKQFFTFKRSGREYMTSRVTNLLSLFNCNDRLIDGEEITLDILLNKRDITYANLEKIEAKKEESLHFLTIALGEVTDCEN